ncbi:MAG: radical SAM protein [Candidatus Sumerlaeia bacterium]|nr:radical SAM protein [Candidatus Sumerlaeia bacterium]
MTIKQRRGAILTHPMLPCLAPYHTLNLTAGCPNKCFYCYAQSYDFVPNWGTVTFFDNTFQRLQEELPRMKRRPKLVYFSTYCEPFLNIDIILETQYKIMKLLLESNISLLISTKGTIPERFINLFSRFPGKVHIQVGITTVNDRIRQLLEPGSASIKDRLFNIEQLLKSRINVEARIDPLLPGLTDTDSSLTLLLETLSKLGVQRAVASYLFLRCGIQTDANLNYEKWSFKKMLRIYTHKVTDYCGSGKIWLPNTDYRRERYVTIKKIAETKNIGIKLCSCKNKDLTTDCCLPLPPADLTLMRQPKFL